MANLIMPPGRYDLVKGTTLVGTAQVDNGTSPYRQWWVVEKDYNWGSVGTSYTIKRVSNSVIDPKDFQDDADTRFSGSTDHFRVEGSVEEGSGIVSGPGTGPGNHLQLDPGAMSIHQDNDQVGETFTLYDSATKNEEHWYFTDSASPLDSIGDKMDLKVAVIGEGQDLDDEWEDFVDNYGDDVNEYWDLLSEKL